MSDVFPAKIAYVLDESTVVINRGADHNLQVGQRLYIWADGPEIRDPDTREILGTIKLTRGTGRITALQEKMATVYSDMEKTVRSKESRPRSFISTGISARDFGSVEIVHKPFDNPAVGDFVAPA